MRRLLLVAVAISLMAAGCGSGSIQQKAASASVTAPRLCTGAQPPARYAHVVWIWMENHALGDVIGNDSAPFETALAHRCGSATAYEGVSHPSLPNYIAATSGETWGIADDGPPSQHRLAVPSIFQQVRSWRAYAESAPGRCVTTSSGRYATRHTPAVYYTRIRAACRERAVPLGTLRSGALAHDLRDGTLPAFSFVTPDTCSDTHDCPVATGDAWLRQWIDRIGKSPDYGAGSTAVFVVWDESGGGPLPFLAIAPSVQPGRVVQRALDHYALLRATEQMLGVGLLGHARDASAAGLAPAFHLLP